MKNTSKILVLVLALAMMFTMASMFTASAEEATAPNYYLVGYINGADYGCEADYANLGEYKFVDGKLTATFTQDSYVFVKTDTNKWYLFNAYCTDTTGTLSENKSEKMFVPGGKELTFTLVVNEDGTLTLSYTYPGMPHSHQLGKDGACKIDGCDYQATFTVAGGETELFGTSWDSANTSNDMVYNPVTGLWSKSYDNTTDATVWAHFKVLLDHAWTTSWGALEAGQGECADNNAWIGVDAGHTLIITFDAETKVVAMSSHAHVWVPATCKTPKMCSVCGATEGEADPTAHYPVLDICALCYLPQPSLSVGANEVVVPPAATEGGVALTVGMVHITEAGKYQVTGSAGQIVCFFTDELYSDGAAWTTPNAGSWLNFSVLPVELAPGYYYVGVYGEGTHTVTISEYVEPVGPVDPIVNVSDLTAGTTTGDELIAGTGISATAGMVIDSNGKEIDGFTFTQRLKLPGSMKVEEGAVVNGIKIVVDGTSKLVVYAIAGNSSATDRTLHLTTLVDGELLTVENGDTGVVAGDKIAKYELAIPEAGTYYLGSTKSGINLYYIAVEDAHEHSFVEGECECGELDAAYVNTLVVGDTNKIIVNGDTFNEYNLPIEWVWFVADEKAHYEFVGNNGALVFIFDLDGNLLCMGTGKADLEAGTYAICVGNGLTGVLNVAVTKSEIVVPEHENKLVIGENNKIYVDGSILNQNNNPIAWVPFVVEEKALYTFASETENALVYIFNSDFSMHGGALTSAAVLEPGNYLICVGNGVVGDIYVTVTKSEVPTTCEHVYVYMNCKLCGAPNPYFAYNLMVVGTNKVVCNEYHLVDTTGHGNPYQFTTFTVTEDGHYKFSVADGKIVGFTIFTTEVSAEGADWTAGTGASWGEYIAGTEADLKAGTYYVGMIFVDGVGEYSITLELVPPHTHTWSEATCTKPAKCECGETKGEALGHDYKDGVCTRCEGADPNYVEPNFFQKIIAWFMDLIQKILGVFKK